MKKTLALLLALCMLLAVTPVLAEENASGTWYLVMMKLTAATFELNEDGTCVMTSFENAEAQKQEGTWSQEGDKVILVVDGDSMDLTFEGDHLAFTEEQLASLGVNDLTISGAEADSSAFASLIKISREPGLLTTSELNAYQDNGVLPEGKTKEDMDAIQEAMLIEMLPLLSSMKESTPSESASGAWYLVVMGLTAGNFELKEDGTCTVTVPGEGGPQTREGTWTQEENKVTLTVESDPMELTYDGANLIFNEEQLASLGLEQIAIEGTEVNLSMAAALIKIAREPGKLTLDEFNAYQDNGVLPEGKTKEDMDAIMAEMLVSFMLLLGNTNNTTK